MALPAKKSVVAAKPATKVVSRTAPAPAKAATAPAKVAAKPASKAAPAAAPKQSLWAKKMKAMKEMWNNKKAESKGGGGSGGTTVSEGRYATRLTGAKLGENDSGMYVRFEFTVAEGDEIGEKAVRFCNLGTEENLVWLQRDLRRLGIDVDEMEIEQIEEAVKELEAAAPGVRINVKQNDQYLNVYIDRLIELEETAVEAVEDPEGETAEEAEEPTEEEPTEEEASEEPAKEEASEEEPTEEEPAAEEEGEPAEEATDEITMGDTVAYLVGRKRCTGVVRAVKGDVVTVLDDATKKKLQFAPDDLEKVAETE